MQMLIKLLQRCKVGPALFSGHPRHAAKADTAILSDPILANRNYDDGLDGFDKALITVLIILVMFGLLYGVFYLVLWLLVKFGFLAFWLGLVGAVIAVLAIYNGIKYAKARLSTKTRTGPAGASYLPLSTGPQESLAHNVQAGEMPSEYPESNTGASK
jgi:hypothetical protein